MPAKLSIGDVLEVVCPPGIAYVSYAGEDPSLGPAIWVVPRIFAEPNSDWSEIFSADGYHVFYAVYSGIRHKHMRRVGHSVDAIRGLPGLRRNAIQYDHAGRATRWLITDGVTHIPRSDSELSPEERQLPISHLWNYRYLIAKIAEGWMPGDPDASLANIG